MNASLMQSSHKVFRGLLLVLFSLLLNNKLTSQVTTPEPCTNPPNGVGCTCGTAGLLCTPDQLDGFSFSMSSTNNDGDLPDGIFNFDLCPGIASQDGFPNNVNFFAFISWCTDLTMDVEITNCQPGPDANSGNYGVQMALFGACGSQGSGWDPIACITEPDESCFNSAAEVPTVQTFTASGLEIGGTYYFMLDGCARSVCDITIDVVGVCGTGMIDDWTTGLEGPVATCVGATDTYTSEDVNGAVEFYYYLDGVLIDDGTNQTSTDITWTDPGTYELCVDVSNLPCVLEEDDPAPDCITIEVIGIGEAEIMADPEILCPDEISTVTSSGINAGNGVSQYIIVVGPDGLVTQVVEGDMTTVTYDLCGVFTAYSYSFLTGEPNSLPNIGDVFNLPDCNAECCDLVSVEISFEDDEDPMILNPPGDLMLECATDLLPQEALDWVDNCHPGGVVNGQQQEDYTLCDGGTVTRIWEVQDTCGNSDMHIQTITIGGIPQAEFVDPPQNETIDCGTLPLSFPSVQALNTGVGGCLIDTLIEPTVNNMVDDCDGIVELTYIFTDICDRTITHIKTYELLPPDEPAFIDPPVNIEVVCASIPPDAGDLSFSNGGTGDCLISGAVPPMIDSQVDECGGTITNTWEYTDVCDRTINHIQVITVTPPDPPTFVDPPSSLTLNCGEDIPAAIDLIITNGQSGDCEINEMIFPIVDNNIDDCDGAITYRWIYVFECGDNIEHTQVITILPPDEAAFIDPPGNLTLICTEVPSDPVDLSYTNGLMDDCLIEGTVSPQIDGVLNICGGDITYTWSFTDDCDREIEHIQVITVLPEESAEFTDLPADITVDCGDQSTNPGPLMYTNNSSGDCLIEGSVPAIQNGNFGPCGEDVTFTWTFTDECGETITHTQTVSSNESDPPMFVSTPADITVSCEDFNAVPPMLDYTNNFTGDCEIAGAVSGVLIGDLSICGTNVEYYWTFTDECNRTIEYTQNITIEPASTPQFVNLPDENITVSCEDVLESIPDMEYTNGESAPCEISGSVPGFQSGSYDECGGTLAYNWSFTDECNFTISFTQNVTVLPAPEPMWIDPPADITLNCGEEVPPPVDIEYSNGGEEVCNISGVVSGNGGTNGLITLYTWEYVNDCTGESLTHVQEILGVTAPEIIVNPSEVIICQGDGFDLNSIGITETTGATSLTVEFLDEDGNPITDAEIFPEESTFITVHVTNEVNCTDQEDITILVESPPVAGTGGSFIVCDPTEAFNLFDYLTPPYDGFGTWTDINGSGANIDDPENATFFGVGEGIYNYEYEVESFGPCPAAFTNVTVQVIEELNIGVLSVYCTNNNSTYTVELNSFGYDISTGGVGDIVIVGTDLINIENIPIGSSLEITISESTSDCSSILIITPPMCDCPSIPSPINNGDESICFGEMVPELSVTVEPNLMANWYDSSVGGSLLEENSLTFIPTISGPGIYMFYVEAIDSDGCVSVQRTPVTLEVFDLPEVVDISPSACDDGSGTAPFALSNFDDIVSVNPSFIVEYYTSQSDAENGVNPLSGILQSADGQVIIAKVINGNGCISYAVINIIVSPLPEFNLQVMHEVCLEDSNGSIIITPLSNLDSISLNFGPFTQDFTMENLVPGPYSFVLKSQEGCTIEVDTSILEGFDILISNVLEECNSNGTATDATDDFYTVSFDVSNNMNSSNGIEVYLDDVLVQTEDYGNITITIDADDMTHIIRVVDITTGCEIEVITSELISCSTDCVITPMDISTSCDGMGTPSDPSDDIITITFGASAINGASSGTFDLFVDNVLTGNYQYGELHFLTFPADGSIISFQLRDNEVSGCFYSENIGPLNPCSDACIINVEIGELCSNNGTIGVEGDDFYEITFNANGINSASEYSLSIDGAMSTSYSFDLEYTVTLPADSEVHSLEFIDIEDSDCTFSYTTSELLPCSGNCMLDATIEDVACYNENTGSDPGDDTFTATVAIAISEGTGSWIIESLGLSGSESEITLGPFLISDGDVSLIIQDAGIASCLSELLIVAPEPCSICEETVDAGPSAVLDCDITEVVLTGVSSSSGSASWMGPGSITSIGDMISATIPGTYIFTVDFGEGCIVSDSTVITVSDAIPIADAGEDMALTCDIDTVTLIGSWSGGGENITYAWLDADGIVLTTDSILVVTEIGDYFFEVTDVSSGCTSPLDLASVIENKSEPLAIIYADPTDVLDCVVEVILISSEEEENVVYSWLVDSESVASDAITIEEPSLIELFALDTISGCTSQNSLEITSLEEYPLISTLDLDLITCADTVITIDASGSQSGPTITYTWYDENNNEVGNGVNQLDVSSPGTYFLELVDLENGCTNIDTIDVIANFDLPEFESTDDSQLTCNENMLLLSASSMNTDVSYSWSTEDGIIESDENSNEILISAPGSYFLSIEDNGNQCVSLDTILVLPPAEIEGATFQVVDESCALNTDAVLSIENVSGGTPPYTYFIDGDEFSGTANQLSSGLYMIEVEDSLDCNYQEEVEIEVLPEVVVDLSPEIILSTNLENMLIATVNISQQDIDSVLWTPTVGLSCPTCLTTTVDFNTAEEEYTVRVVDVNGCEGIATVRLFREEIEDIFTPNVISSNGDNNNDGFTLYSNIEGTIIEELKIFDRWGNLMYINLMFDANDPTLGWDGTYNGKDVRPGVFVYYAVVRFPNGNSESLAGDITVLR